MFSNRQIQRSSIFAAAIGACAMALLGNNSMISAAIVPVTPSTMIATNWAFNSNDPSAAVIVDADHIGDLVTGPASPPLGTGSAELKIINGNGDGSEQLRNTNYAGTPLSSITSLGYSTYDVTNNGQQFPYLKLYVSTTGGATADDALYFEPPYQTHATGSPTLPDQGATALNTWQNWDALGGGWWNDNGGWLVGGNTVGTPGAPSSSSGGVASLASYLADYPDATIVNDGTLGGVRLTVGYSSHGDNYEGYVDAFTIGVGGNETTFNFEAASVPEPASLGLLSLGGLAMLRRRRRTSTSL